MEVLSIYENRNFNDESNYKLCSFLQSYALKCMVRKFCEDIEFLDIGSQRHIYYNMYPKNPRYLTNIIKAKLHGILGHDEVYHIMVHERRVRKFCYTLYNKFPGWWSNYLGMKLEDNLNVSYDMIIIGSDEVFNCTQVSEWGTSMNMIIY